MSAEGRERRMLDELLRQRRRFRMALRAARAGAWEWDIATNRTLWSEENYELLGLPPGKGETTYGDWLERVHPEDRADAEREVERAVRAKGDLDMEFRVVWPDGTVRWLRDVGKMMLDERGEPIAMFGIQMDITDRHDLEKGLRQAQRMEAMGLIAGLIAHDFNNLLTVIAGNASRLRDHLSERGEPDSMVGEIEHAAKRAADLTGKLLAFGRRQVLRPEVLDLRGLIDGVAELLRGMLGESVELEIRHPPAPVVVRADPTLLEQVLFNLAINSHDAMPSGGKVTVETGHTEVELTDAPALSVEAGSYVTLSFRDSGQGMDRETCARVFEPFFSTKPADQGTGLGLASAYGIVRQSGGEIVVESAPGHGSIFTVYLPRIEGEAPKRKSEPEPPASVEGNETILVVEDEPAILYLIESVLEERGYRILTAPSAEAALESRLEDPVDLLMTDVVLPGVSGPELARRVRKLHPRVKVLYLSGYSDDELRTKGVSEADTELLPKPFRTRDLEVRVRSLLD